MNTGFSRPVLAGAALLAAAAIWTVIQRNSASPSPPNSGLQTSLSHPPVGGTEVSDPSLVIQPTQLDWYGKPVYRLTNTSANSYSRLELFNASYHRLPILYVGNNPPPKNLLAPLHEDTFHLTGHSSLWFTGTSKPPTDFFVMWSRPGGAVYENVTVGSQSRTQ